MLLKEVLRVLCVLIVSLCALSPVQTVLPPMEGMNG